MGEGLEQVGDVSSDHGPVEMRELVERLVDKPVLVLSTREVADRTGLSVERVAEVHIASGFEPVDPDEPAYAVEDVETFDVMRQSAELFSWEEAIAFCRVLGSSLARVAEAANSMFHDAVETPMLGAGASAHEVAGRAVEAYELSQRLASVVQLLVRQHLGLAVERSRRSFAMPGFDAGDAAGAGMAPLAIGFVDLVGFTSRSAQMSAHDLAALVDRFEGAAHETVTVLGGRLVKLIGDEVMFSAVEPATGVRIAAALLDRFAGDPELKPRGGLAYGPVVSRRGDHFGPIVNLASRLVDEAVPGEVLLTAEAATHAPVPVEPAGRRMVKGFAEPVVVMSLTR